jgi:hypothetical protein
LIRRSSNAAASTWMLAGTRVIGGGDGSDMLGACAWRRLTVVPFNIPIGGKNSHVRDISHLCAYCVFAPRCSKRLPYGGPQDARLHHVEP